MSEPACKTCGQRLVPATPKEIVDRPENFEIKSVPGGVMISRRWFGWAGFISFGVLCAFMNVFLFFWLLFAAAAAVKSLALGALLGLPAVVLGAALHYYLLAIVVNSTRIAAGAGVLEVWYGPLPIGFSKKFSRDAIEQIFVKERTFQSPNGESPPPIYAVHALLRSGESVALVHDAPLLEQARFIEQEVERALGIRDKAVPGEYR